jgi:hypothetical protein
MIGILRMTKHFRVPSLAASRKPKRCSTSGGQHNVTADVEVISIQQVNEAYERMLKSDVKYRFSIDMASLKS